MHHLGHIPPLVLFAAFAYVVVLFAWLRSRRKRSRRRSRRTEGLGETIRVTTTIRR
jgi:membrane protein implicated in regulation of membrane protease activity